MVARDHEHAWAEALAQEHAHQRELLAALRDELGSFARECASALTALDALVGLAGVSELLAESRNAAVAAQVGRRLRDDERLQRLYESLGGGDVEAPLVKHADELLRSGPKRSDRELLSAVVSASGAAVRIEELVGPAPWAALAALRPLAKWAARLPHADADARRELRDAAAADLSQVLGGAAQLGAGTGAALAGEASAIADSLRDTVEHVEAAARSIRDGKLDEVLVEMRRTLEEDLDRLRAVHESAHEAAEEWRAARKAEHAELSEEVHTKLDRVERIRGVLGRMLPHLQATSRVLGALQKLHALEGRLEPGAAPVVQASLLGWLAALWDAAFGAAPSAASGTPRRRRVRTRWIVAVVAALVAAVLAAVFGVVLSGGSAKPTLSPVQAATTVSGGAAAAKPVMKPVSASFSEAQRATFYTVSLASGESATYSWRLQPPKDNTSCNDFHQLSDKPNEAVWHHAATDGCTHLGFQHLGTVVVTVTTPDWSCTESFFGTLTRTGAHNERCVRR